MKGRQPGRVLVVEDNDALRGAIVEALRESWEEVHEEAGGEAALARLSDPSVPPYDVIVSDLRLPGADGIRLLRAARARDPRTAVVLMTAYGSIETAVEAMKLGAADFLQKPFDLEQLEVRVERAFEHVRLLREVSTLRAERASRFAPERLVGRSPKLRAALELARRVAPTRATVLITGETGTGKELVAGMIHALSLRAEGPFVKVNCAALPETLLESELFGHERGAFTGAERTRIGRFEQAHRGTLFLDEVAELSPATQAKLLRVLQDGEFQRVGGTRPVRCDTRVVAATNQDLERALAEGRFREDLYFRLHVIGIHLPPLRERPEDIELLAHHFLAHFSHELGRPGRRFSPEALARIRAHSWPGNVRELRNVIERAVLLAEGERIEADDVVLGLGPHAAMRTSAGGVAPAIELPPEGISLRDVERTLVMEALRRTEFVQKEAARLLGVSRRKLNYMIQRMGITHPNWRRNRPPAQQPAEPQAAGRLEDRANPA